MFTIDVYSAVVIFIHQFDWLKPEVGLICMIEIYKIYIVVLTVLV